MIVTVASFKGGVGKTTTALHLAAYFQTKTNTLLVDGDLNRSALEWANRGQLPFKVVDEKQAVKFARTYEHIIIDTPARPSPDELKTIAEGCDLLVLPTSPDALALGATLQMVDALKSLQTHYKILLTSGGDKRPLKPVNQVKGDSYAGIAWRCYFEVGKEILP